MSGTATIACYLISFNAFFKETARIKTLRVVTSLIQAPFEYAIVRILGNDLIPRHGEGQTLSNLLFTLENEPDFENCKKLWLVNRIVNKQDETAVIKLLDQHQQTYIHIPFETDNYKLEWTKYEKLRYIIKLNNARNMAIIEGRKLAKWVFPLDGNIFIDQNGWNGISLYLQNLNNKLFKLMMYRIKDNNTEVFNFSPKDYDKQEPQVIVCQDCNETFNEDLAYANGNKEEFLYRFPTAPCLEYVIRLNDHTQGYITEKRWDSRIKAIPIIVNTVDQIVIKAESGPHQLNKQ
ncbi:hypothetical protein N9J52_04165 [Flavobacteriales bacterium]|nr:hypothetical protein [Flavobacteriales bacterium]